MAALRRFRGARKWVGWILGGLGIACVAAYLALQTRAARAYLRDTILRKLDGSIEGGIELGKIARLSLRSIVLDSVSVRDPGGKRVLYLQRIMARPSWFGL